MSTSTLGKTLDRETIGRLFEGSRTTNTFTDEPVDPALIQKVYEDLRWAPTAFNSQPLRLTILTDGDARDAVVEHMMDANQAKTKAAPLTIVAAWTADWHEHMPTLQPQREGARERFAEAEGMRKGVGEQSALIQVGYLITALRAHGLEVGPMTGLKASAFDEILHAENGWKTLVVINVGHAANPDDEDAVRPRAGRLEFSEASQIL
ncbi:malonic semialdehyde reductase [Nesterenkonia populi]|uniref:malonic semialdehyde reductase n=1 Tax=Nesterenkonia populi TaxID=1591087 RepID=UPI0011BEBE6C|nr:malonic semialdehyde reductase [Nesterenkonia populi]